MNGRLVSALGAIMCLAFAGATPAATLYSQTSGMGSHIGWASDPKDNIKANTFSLATAGTVTSLTWRGGHNNGFGTGGDPLESDVFTINFYSDAAGEIGDLLQSFPIGDSAVRTDTLMDQSNSDIYEYVASLGSGIALSSGTDYWISIYNDTTADGDELMRWVWKRTDPLGPIAWSLDLGANWMYYEGDLFYFSLDGVLIPIPAAAWLFGSALGLLGWLKRKTTRRKGGFL